jgi:hypothetical protein
MTLMASCQVNPINQDDSDGGIFSGCCLPYGSGVGVTASVGPGWQDAYAVSLFGETGLEMK